MKILFALIAAVVLLFGCTASVPQEKYNALSATCEKAKSDSASALASEVAKTSAANGKLSACTDEKASLESLVTVREQENEGLRAQAAVLDAARAKTGLAAEYNATVAYYMDAYGPGKIINTANRKRIDDRWPR